MNTSSWTEFFTAERQQNEIRSRCALILTVPKYRGPIVDRIDSEDLVLGVNQAFCKTPPSWWGEALDSPDEVERRFTVHLRKAVKWKLLDAINDVKSRSRFGGLLEDCSNGSLSAGAKEVKREQEDKLHEAIENLGEQHKLVLNKMFWEGQSQEKIAEQLGGKDTRAVRRIRDDILGRLRKAMGC